MALISQAEWARKHGFSRQYANQLIKEGTLKAVEGKVDEEQADMALAAIRDLSKTEKRSSQESTELSTLLLKTRIKNEMERGKLLEARAKVEIGELIAVDEVKQAAFNKARIVRDNLLNIPDRVANLLASVDDASKIHELLSQEIRNSLEGLSRDES
ncbi:MAG: hypothetical protein CMO81_11770 [Waddliaceae bacterium]|nr:hypothetical protein [Waddliaceae bacterium]